ncbi:MULTISPECIES: GntR family transcriptional regulator [unclassified Microbacterium]|uniref:GntR family transcriptional regulator n=1 Tax=unclassified Microbacterium TaxID=2609290 RepID=UPI003852650B
MSDSNPSANERAYQTIRNGILDGIHAPGSMLGEASLAQEIGVSRTPVRSALARLQDEGWITVYPKRGALVNGLSERAAADLADARLMLETAGVARASTQARHGLASRLTASIGVQREAFAARDVRAFIESTIDFHRSFVESAENTVLLELNDRLADRQRFLLFSYGDLLLARCAEIIAEHERLVGHLASDNAEDFAAALRDHLAGTYGTAQSDNDPAREADRRQLRQTTP